MWSGQSVLWGLVYIPTVKCHRTCYRRCQTVWLGGTGKCPAQVVYSSGGNPDSHRLSQLGLSSGPQRQGCQVPQRSSHLPRPTQNQGEYNILYTTGELRIVCMFMHSSLFDGSVLLLQYVNPRGKEITISGARIVVAVGTCLN